MKINLTLTILLFVSLILSSCEKEDFRYEDDFGKSYSAWLSFKESSGNSYRYTATGGSWAGSGWQTVITVENGKVTQRQFLYTAFNDVRMPAGGWNEENVQKMIDDAIAAGGNYPGTAQELLEELAWTEEGAAVGAREPHIAANPNTLDEVYALARNDFLQKREGAETYFEATNNGMISSCGYVIDGCQDDCFNGISISSIEKLQ